MDGNTLGLIGMNILAILAVALYSLARGNGKSGPSA